MEGRRDLLAFFTRSAGELMDDWFESDAIKAAFGFDAVVDVALDPGVCDLGCRFGRFVDCGHRGFFAQLVRCATRPPAAAEQLREICTPLTFETQADLLLVSDSRINMRAARHAPD